MSTSPFGLRQASLTALRRVWVVMSLALVSSCFSQQIPGLGDRVIPFELKSLEGEALSFQPASERTHILYFWADWCPRCEDDFRLMEKLYQRWKTEPQAPVFLAIDVGQSEEHVRNFVQRLKTSFPIYMDKEGKVARSLGVKGLPTYFIVDKHGTIRHVALGWVEENHFLSEISKIK